MRRGVLRVQWAVNIVDGNQRLEGAEQNGPDHKNGRGLPRWDSPKLVKRPSGNPAFNGSNKRTPVSSTLVGPEMDFPRNPLLTC